MKALITALRCITSKRVCFPLIFTIASVSLIISLIEFSKVTTPHLYWKQAPLAVKRRDVEHVNGIKLWEEWLPDGEQVVPTFKRPLLRPAYPKRSVKVMEKRSAGDGRSARKVNGTDHHVNTSDAQAGPQRQKNFDGPVLYNASTPVEFNDTFAEGTLSFNAVETTEVTEEHTVGKIVPLPEQTKGVIILTNYRSGSTFLGELFNQHSQAFYTFEPLYPFGTNCTFELPRRISLLQDMMKCTFPDMKTLYQDIGRSSDAGQNHNSCMRNNFCFRYNHKDLCTEELCPKGNRQTCFSCGPVDLDRVNNKCRSKKMSVIKVIKLCDILELEPLIHDPSLDFKILHLVRDPRGIASSRWKIHSNMDAAQSVLHTCQRQMVNVKSGRSVDWLKNRYKLIRYEDLASKPIDLAADIYKFVDLPFEKQMKSWIIQNTQSRQSQSSKNKAHSESVDKRKEADESVANPYSTHRNSNAAMQAWREHLPFGTVYRIQKRCFGTMRSLGYKDFKTEYDLLNLNLSAVV